MTTASLLRTILVLPALAAIGAAGFLACAALAWRYRWWKLGGRIYYTATAVAVALFLAMASTYNLVGWPLL